MKIFNENLERITILHMAGKTTMPEFKTIIEGQKQNLIIKDDSISIIIIATKNYIKDSPVINQLKFNNIRYYNGAQELDEEGWSNSMKIDLILNNLKKIKTEYTLILDARDVLICDHLNKTFINKFKKLNTKILFNASSSRYPSWINIKAIDTKYKNNLNSKPFLNTGVCFGETKALYAMYQAASEINKKYGQLNKSEQFILKLAIVLSNLTHFVSLDNEDKLFKCVHQSINKPDFLVIRESSNYIIKNIRDYQYKTSRYKKKIKLKLEKAKLILYPNSKGHEEEVKAFISKVRK